MGWGTGVIPRLSADLTREFPDQTGWSPTNLNDIRMFAARWPGEEISQQLAEKLPWGHIMALMDKTDFREELVWYAKQTVSEGWSRAVLAHQIQSGLRQRLGVAPSNFPERLASPDSDLAQQMTAEWQGHCPRTPGRPSRRWRNSRPRSAPRSATNSPNKPSCTPNRQFLEPSR